MSWASESNKEQQEKLSLLTRYCHGHRVNGNGDGVDSGPVSTVAVAVVTSHQ